MERLTYKNERGEWCVNKTAQIAVVQCQDNYRKYYIGELIDRLAELENKLGRVSKIECRELVKLPCKVGDTVYIIPSRLSYELNKRRYRENDNRIFEEVVDEVTVTINGWIAKICNCQKILMGEFLGKNWFLTKAEAQEKLDKFKKESDKSE